MIRSILPSVTEAQTVYIKARAEWWSVCVIACASLCLCCCLQGALNPANNLLLAYEDVIKVRWLRVGTAVSMASICLLVTACPFCCDLHAGHDPLQLWLGVGDCSRLPGPLGCVAAAGQLHGHQQGAAQPVLISQVLSQIRPVPTGHGHR